MGSLFTAEQEEFYRSHCRDMTYAEQVELLRQRFGLEVTTSQIKTWRSNHAFFGKQTGRFAKGHVPANKGSKGVCATGSEKGWFKIGNKPHNTREPLSERLLSDGYVAVKLPDGKRVYKHRWLYEQAHGKIPRGMKVIFLNGDKTDFSLGNLACVTCAELAIANKKGVLCGDSALSMAGLLKIRMDQRIKHIENKE